MLATARGSVRLVRPRSSWAWQGCLTANSKKTWKQVIPAAPLWWLRAFRSGWSSHALSLSGESLRPGERSDFRQEIPTGLFRGMNANPVRSVPHAVLVCAFHTRIQRFPLCGLAGSASDIG